MRSSLRLLPVFLFVVVVTAAAAGTRQPLTAAPSASAQNPAVTSLHERAQALRFELLPTAQNACGQCEAKVAPLVQACKDGSIKSCYQAAAALCQCNLDAGGCGSDREALRECVRDNNRLAAELK
jgi:hypothetical protein